VAIRDFTDRTVLVTGAASGIGRATALAFAREGATLVVCDVNESGLEETAAQIRALGRPVLARRVDVTSAAAVEELAVEVHREHPALDVLVNNAGVGLGGGLLDTTLADWDWILGINVRGVVHGCHFFLPNMVARGQGGHVVNLSSVAGYVATAELLAYGVTKFAVFGLSEALRQELRPHGIGVTAVCPGIINTPITATSPMRGPNATPEARKVLVAMYERRGYGPERVAANIVKAVRKNRAVAPVSPEAWVLYFLKRLSPALTAWISRRLAARLQREVARARG
jgi:NAD(P)-dependent dehydrogenase (short-subunit alcohol dehydrogenase family)